MGGTLHLVFTIVQGRPIAQAVSRRVPSQVRSCGWMKYHRARLSPSTSVSPANSHSTQFSIYHPRLVQYAN
jgi:hypothetical protein